MARRANSPYRIHERNGHAQIDFKLGAERVRRTLEDEVGAPVPYRDDGASAGPCRRALEAAARYFAGAVAGRSLGQKEGKRVITEMTLEEGVAVWLDAVETPTNHQSILNWKSYGRSWSRFASDGAILADGSARWKGDARTPLERFVSDEAAEDYAFARLPHAVRESVRKELVARASWLRWMKAHKMIASVPPHFRIPRTEPGVRTGNQKTEPVEIDPTEARAIVDALPEWSNDSAEARHSGRRFRVRDVFDLQWETGLRPITIGRLVVPTNYARGSKFLVITEADDKARYDRVLPLTARARAILDRCAPADGPIFGAHDYRHFIKAAALKALPTAKAQQFAAYDFRHGRAVHLLEVSANLPGVAYLLGHKQITTTNQYIKANRRQAEAVVAAEELDTVMSPKKGSDREAARNAAILPKKIVGASGFEPPTLRPPVHGPARSPEENAESGGESAPQVPQDSAGSVRDSDTVPSPLTDAVRGLAMQAVVWDAFDLLAAEEIEP